MGAIRLRTEFRRKKTKEATGLLRLEVNLHIAPSCGRLGPTGRGGRLVLALLEIDCGAITFGLNARK